MPSSACTVAHFLSVASRQFGQFHFFRSRMPHLFKCLGRKLSIFTFSIAALNTWAELVTRQSLNARLDSESPEANGGSKHREVESEILFLDRFSSVFQVMCVSTGAKHSGILLCKNGKNIQRGKPQVALKRTGRTQRYCPSSCLSEGLYTYLIFID